MSHVVGIDLIIKNLTALDRSCKELGLILHRGQKTFKWYGRWVNDYAAKDAAYKLGIDPKDYGKCEHAISVPKSDYEIGLCNNPNGEGYLPVFDFFGTGRFISDAVGGNEADKLRQLYAANVTELEMAEAGMQTERQWLPDGALNVMVSQQA